MPGVGLDERVHAGHDRSGPFGSAFRTGFLVRALLEAARLRHAAQPAGVTKRYRGER